MTRPCATSTDSLGIAYINTFPKLTPMKYACVCAFMADFGTNLIINYPSSIAHCTILPEAPDL